MRSIFFCIVTQQELEKILERLPETQKIFKEENYKYIEEYYGKIMN